MNISTAMKFFFYIGQQLYVTSLLLVLSLQKYLISVSIVKQENSKLLMTSRYILVLISLLLSTTTSTNVKIFYVKYQFTIANLKRCLFLV